MKGVFLSHRLKPSLRFKDLLGGFFLYFSFALIVLFFITSCDKLIPPTNAPFEKKEVKLIFYSLMEIAEKEYGIKPIKNLRKPQPIKDYVRSFNSHALFKKNLENAFLKNGYSYSKTLNEVARNGITIIMDFDGGVDMIVLLVMPSKGIKIKEIDTIFSGQELKDFETVLDLVDRYMCCPSLDDF